MSAISSRNWFEICRTYGTQAAWVVGAADRRPRVAGLKPGVTRLAVPMALVASYRLQSLNVQYRKHTHQHTSNPTINPYQPSNAVGMTSLVTPGFNPEGGGGGGGGKMSR